MRLFDIFGEMLRTLWAHKLRSFLTMFGIAWGVGSLLLLIGLGEGFRSGNRKQIESMGENIMFIFPGRVPAVEGSVTGARPYNLTYKDVLDIKSEARNVRDVAPVLQRQDVRMISEYASAGGALFGSTPNFNTIRYLPLAEGRWLNANDEDQKRNVVVIGDEVRRNLFPNEKPLGAFILLNGMRFQVIGTLQRVGRGDNNATNMRAFIPYSVMSQAFPPKGPNVKEGDLSFINFAPHTREGHAEAREDVRRIVARNHSFDYALGDDAFEDWDTVEMQKKIGGIFDAMNMFLGGVGIVTLMLGGIGIVNIMLVSVSERTKEIGLRMALGATKRSILFQFFLEGAFLTLLSGGVGLVVAGGFMAALGLLPSPPGFDTPKLVPWSAALAIGTLSLAGVMAGLYPARQAAMLDPVEALRKE